MYSNKTIAERFADGATSGKSSNMFIDGNTIYSYGYHFPIASRVTHRGIPTMLLTRDGYSVSTARHISHVRNAIHGIPVIELHNYGGKLELNAENIERTRRQVSKELIEAKQKLLRARVEHMQKYWGDKIYTLYNQHSQLVKLSIEPQAERPIYEYEMV